MQNEVTNPFCVLGTVSNEANNKFDILFHIQKVSKHSDTIANQYGWFKFSKSGYTANSAENFMKNWYLSMGLPQLNRKTKLFFNIFSIYVQVQKGSRIRSWRLG